MNMEKKIQKVNHQNIRTIDNDVLIPVLRELIENGQEVRMTVSGNSMNPLICHNRDSVILKAPEEKLKRGDIAFYQRKNGQYVLHRICRVDHDGGIYCIGDAQTLIEGPLSRDQFFAVVKSVERKGKWIEPGSFWWWFFEKVWLRVIPLRRLLMRLYGMMSKIIK